VSLLGVGVPLHFHWEMSSGSLEPPPVKLSVLAVPSRKVRILEWPAEEPDPVPSTLRGRPLPLSRFQVSHGVRSYS
jgi:hypothetical protein